MQFVVYCAYRGKLETAFLAAELSSAAAADTRRQEASRASEDFASPFGSPTTQGAAQAFSASSGRLYVNAAFTDDNGQWERPKII